MNSEKLSVDNRSSAEANNISRLRKKHHGQKMMSKDKDNLVKAKQVSNSNIEERKKAEYNENALYEEVNYSY